MRLSVSALALGALLAFPAAAAAQQRPDTAALPDTARVGERARVKAGDQLALRIIREPEMSGTYLVRQDGAALLPRLGDVRVVDLTAGALQDTLRRRYADFLRDPELEVTVLRRIAVSGEVRKPDLYMVDLTMTLRDVIARAGGITDAGNPSRIQVIRDGSPLDLGGDRTAQFLTAELRSGDQVVVGRRSWWALNPTVAVSTATGLVTFLIGIYQLVHK
jgi:protein involved in polysaccharide export with SLBB domain